MIEKALLAVRWTRSCIHKLQGVLRDLKTINLPKPKVEDNTPRNP